MTYSELPGGIDPSTSPSHRILNNYSTIWSCICAITMVERLSQSWQKSLLLHLGLSADLLVAANSNPFAHRLSTQWETFLCSQSITTSDFVKLSEWYDDGPLPVEILESVGAAISSHFQMPRGEDLQSRSPANPCQKCKKWESEAANITCSGVVKRNKPAARHDSHESRLAHTNRVKESEIIRRTEATPCWQKLNVVLDLLLY